MLFGLAAAAGQGMDPVTGGMITCNPGDTFDPTTTLCFDPSGDAGNAYAGALTLPPTVAFAGSVSGSTMLLVGLAAVAALFLMGHGGGQ